MATGSGKTLVMAGLMLYLYEKGYRNFLFFVNSNNIIKKTKDNFLNPKASKYLFNDKIVINGAEVYIKETDTYESADDKNINIKFTTIQQLRTTKSAPLATTRFPRGIRDDVPEAWCAPPSILDRARRAQRHLQRGPRRHGHRGLHHLCRNHALHGLRARGGAGGYCAGGGFARSVD